MSFFKKLFGSFFEWNKSKRPVVSYVNRVEPKNSDTLINNVQPSFKVSGVQENGFSEKELVSIRTTNLDTSVRFVTEIEGAFPYYFSKPEMKNIEFVLKNENNENVAPHLAYSEEYKEWSSTKSIWDRRSIIFKILDSLFSNKLELWQLLDRFTNDRDSKKALEIVAEHAKEDEFSKPDFLCALGRAHFFSGDLIQAESQFNKSLEIDRNHKKTKICLADLLYCSSREKEANLIYEEVLKSCKDVGENEPSLMKLVGLQGYIDSPVYAINCLKNRLNITENEWNEVANEYYYCPNFRAKHAYFLIGKQENLKGLAKLNSLTIEMPWYKEAVVNTHSIIEQLGFNDLMKADKFRLEKIMADNYWE